MDNPDYIIGIIDSYGHIDYRKINCNDPDQMHEAFWFGRNKRWRFIVRDWELQKSCLSCDGFTEEEMDRILALMRRIVTPPDWVIRGEIWEKYGRPRSGRKRTAYLKELERWGISE